MNDVHGNTIAREGVDRCGCGCKYWEHDRCVDCGAPVQQRGTLDGCDHCGSSTHIAEYHHEGSYGEGPIFAVICDVDNPEGLTDFVTTEVVSFDPTHTQGDTMNGTTTRQHLSRQQRTALLAHFQRVDRAVHPDGYLRTSQGINRRTVDSLERRGLVEFRTYGGRWSTQLTDTGLKALGASCASIIDDNTAELVDKLWSLMMAANAADNQSHAWQQPGHLYGDLHAALMNLLGTVYGDDARDVYEHMVSTGETRVADFARHVLSERLGL